MRTVGRLPRVVMVAASLAVAGASVAACGSSPTLRGTDVERVLVDGFAAQVGGSFSATCPSPIPAEQGRSVTCTVTDLDDGTTVQVEVTQDDADGAFGYHATTVTPGGS